MVASLEERQLRVGVFSTACEKDQYIAAASMDVCLVPKPKRRFSFSATAHLSRRCVGRVASTSWLHHQHSGKGGSRSAPQPLIDTNVHLRCVTLYKKGPKFSLTVESRSLQHLPCYTDGDKSEVLPKLRGLRVIPPPPSLPPSALLPAPTPLLRERFPEYHDRTASKRKRPVGQLLPFHPNWRLASGKWARGAGAQMRRNALPPLLPIETKRGEPFKAITQQAHPFTIAPELPSALEEAVNFLRNPVDEIRSFRMARMHEFERAAHGRNREYQRSATQKLHAQRRAERTATLCVQALRFAGRKFHDFDVGEIEPSHLWSPFFPPAHPFFDERELPLRAWALRYQVVEKVQRPVLPEHRGLAVIALCEPGGCSPCFFCMVGHPFGMTSSVFNYCRRAVLTAFLVKHLGLCCLNYFDD